MKSNFDFFFFIYIIKNISIHSAGCIQESIDALEERLPKFRSIVTDEIVVQCSAFIRQVSDIPRLYRRTNREVSCLFDVWLVALMYHDSTYVPI